MTEDWSGAGTGGDGIGSLFDLSEASDDPGSGSTIVRLPGVFFGVSFDRFRISVATPKPTATEAIKKSSGISKRIKRLFLCGCGGLVLLAA